MKLLRIHIRGWTASFRYPTFISGLQPTLPVPPLSTIYGLLSATRAETITPKDVAVGYVFQSKGKAIDLEAIYELHDTPLRANTNVVRRQLLYEPEMYLYLEDITFEDAFKTPCYPLLLGRSTELAMVEEVKIIEVEKRQDVRVGGSIFPFPTEGIYGILQALPTYMTDEMPRRAVGTRPFLMVETDFSEKNLGKKSLRCPFPIYYDEEKDWGVFIHHA